jgi:hypothetical protein
MPKSLINKTIFMVSLITSNFAIAEVNKVTFPQNIDELIHYTTVTRGSSVEHMLTSQAAIDAVKEGKAIPDGTHVVLVDNRPEGIFRYFVMEKGKDFGEEYPTARRTGDWQFQWFKPDQTVKLDEQTERCQACHSRRDDRQYLYTFSEMKMFDGHRSD